MPAAVETDARQDDGARPAETVASPDDAGRPAAVSAALRKRLRPGVRVVVDGADARVSFCDGARVVVVQNGDERCDQDAAALAPLCEACGAAAAAYCTRERRAEPSPSHSLGARRGVRPKTSCRDGLRSQALRRHRVLLDGVPARALGRAAAERNGPSFG